ncbi:hypothetical protein DENIS_0570 [Desulfonema ishimotonii]|uniref:PhoU domain-containing protein n=1 Tax=Desulfonema ishimotonii TaxID=45657 RepID=A0A401FRP4_9BACT|nr:PhoU domain-containing protein [Desulfonema ishimotonii]GBC59631.1 hypothetical protein DENIS_0570 [Desulfonema ishimotonii]
MENIVENFRFLAIETENQVKLTYGLLSRFDEKLLDKIGSKDDYIDNLKTTVENACFSRIHSSTSHISPEKLNDIRAIHIICVNLERVADFCVNITRQLQYLSDPSFIQRYDYKTMFAEIQKGLSAITPVFDNRTLSGALDVCRVEFHADRHYKENFDQIMADLKKGKNAPDLITTIFIFRYLERIGDAILNIGEALIFAIIGDRIKIRQFDALQQTLSESGFEGDFSDIDFSSILGSRSGCRIGKVGDKRPSGFKAQGIFKEGSIRKIRQEKENIMRWDAAFPGLAPRVFGYHESDTTASLLVEFLPGCTMDQVILTGGPDVTRNVFFLFEQTVGEIWQKTREAGAFETDYMDQLKSRLGSVCRVHPYFSRDVQHMGGLRIPSTDELIETCSRIERQVSAPFSVFIHGDFNTNNIVYNHSDQKLNYIDLYRSRRADYIQDASVFLVSNFRLPVFEPGLRARLNTVSLYFFEFFANFAEKNNDRTFEIRLALALARSFYTSTRFELNYDFAREMTLRSHFLMEKISAHEGKSWETFRLPESVLFY